MLVLDNPVVTRQVCQCAYRIFSSDQEFSCPGDCRDCIALLCLYAKKGGKLPNTVAHQLRGFEFAADAWLEMIVEEDQNCESPDVWDIVQNMEPVLAFC